jgi:hypothetical protein
MDVSSTAFEEWNAQVRLKSLEMLGDCGLADVTGLRRPAHAPVVEHGKEQLQAVECQTGLGHRV